MVAALIAPARARAEHDRVVPGGLGESVSSEHFVVHYDPSTATLAAANAVSEDLEESHSKLVAGGTGTPNAGLNAPIADSDGKTDAYLGPPSNRPGFSGGTVVDDTHGGSSYMFLTPDMSRSDTRFRAAHEYMHVIQGAYVGPALGLLTESTANWAAEWALPDADPLDNNFYQPFVPLDCAYLGFTVSGDADPSDCGQGYWQWSFIWRLSQWYGVGIVDALLDRMAVVCPFNCNTAAADRQVLAETVAAQPDDETLGTRYAQYARDVWVPARWTTPAPLPTGGMAAIHAFAGEPAATTVTAATPDTGTVNVVVDHLATRYVVIRNDGGYEPTGPGAELEIVVGRPTAQTAPFEAVVFNSDGTANDDFTLAGPGGGSVGTTADPAALQRVVVPITNDTTSDGQTFSYRVRYFHGTPTPPANDLQTGALSVSRGVEATTNNVYAGGRGNVDEGTDCPGAQDATRGVWFSYTTEAAGQHTYDATQSTFARVISLYDHDTGAFQGCSSVNGQLNAFQPAGKTYDVYVGRKAGHTGFGTSAKLTVTGPAAPLPTVTLTSPSDGATLTTGAPQFSGSATDRSGDSATVTVKVWSGTDTTVAPVRTLAATRSGTSWSVGTTGLASGSYTWRAEQVGSSGTGSSGTRTFTVDVPPVPTVGLTTPADGATLTTSAPQFSGTATNHTGDSATVTVKVWSGTDTAVAAVRTLAATRSGTSWSIGTTGLANGSYTWRAEQVGTSGTGTSAARTFTIAVPGPSVPTVTLAAPAEGATLTSDSPQFSGTAGDRAGDDATVTVKVWSGTDTAAAPVRTLAATRSGTSWSIATTGLPNGGYTWRAEQVGTSGTGFSATRAVTIAVPAPSVGLTSPGEGATVTTSAPQFSGTATDRAGDSQSVTVKVWSGTDTTVAPVRTLAATRTGTSWSVGTTGLANGSYTWRAEQIGSSGTGLSATRTFTVDAAAPLPPPTVTLTSPGDDATLTSSSAQFSGTATDRTGDSQTVTVKVWVNTNTGVVPVRTLTTTRSGTAWSVGTTGLANGSYIWQAEQSGADDVVGVSATRTFRVQLAATADDPTPPASGPATITPPPGTSGGESPFVPPGPANPLPRAGGETADCTRARSTYAAAKRKVKAAKKALKKAKGATKRKAATKRLRRSQSSLRRALAQRRRFCGVR